MKTSLWNEPCRQARTNWLRIISLIALGALVAGCPAGRQTGEPAAAGSGAKVIIKGSNTIGEELGPRLIADFKKEHPAITFELEPKATMYGLAALRVGQCDIAAASRPMLKEEAEVAETLGIKLNEHVLGAYSVAVVLNDANPVSNLTREQVRDIFVGTIQNWKEVGGPDAAIQLYIRDPISGTYLGFQELAMEKQPYAPHSKMQTNYAGIVQAVAKDPHGIGYSSLEQAKLAGVKALSIGGVEPNPNTVHNGKYPYARVLRLFTNKARESGPTGEFVQYVVSPRGQAVVAEAGFTPRP